MKPSFFPVRIFTALIVVAGLASCDKPATTGVNKFADTVFVQIAQFQDQRLSDSLYKFLDHENSFYRKDAALAFASVQDSMAVTRLAKLLNDGEKDVRKAAAFAIGQTSCAESTRALAQAFDLEKDPGVLSAILEGFGKTTKHWDLANVPDQTSLAAGLGWSFYRAGVNGAADSVVNLKAVRLLNSSFPDSARRAAANYFSRAAKKFDGLRDSIIKSAQQDPSEYVRMASTLALRKIKHDAARSAAESILKHDKDYRVRVNATRALQAFPFDLTKSSLLLALKDESINVRVAASEAIKGSISKETWKEIADVARANADWRVQANLYEAALAASGDLALAKEIEKAYVSSSHTYQKAALLGSLQHSFSSRDFIAEKISMENAPVIRNAAASALVALNYQKPGDKTVQKTFAPLYAKGMRTGDPAVIAIFAQALGDSVLGYKTFLKDFTFLYDAKKMLTLPKDNETLQPLEGVIAYFENKKAAAVKNSFNHPIDWTLVKRIPRDQKAVIKTTRGEITVRFFVEEAPGSVANFISLIQQKFFDHKIFHRVVPNFVVQVGCPRGDGFGSADYFIRSEFSQRRYTTGSLGMASAGKDTESIQWFITHSPTPHLDGKYSIFAEVLSGMGAVHGIEIGDEITEVILIPALTVQP